MPYTADERREIYAQRKAARLAGPQIACACGCGVLIPAITRLGKPARFKHGHNPDSARSRFVRGHDRGQEGVAARRAQGKLSGPGHPRWKGGETRDKWGYVRIVITPEQAAIWPTTRTSGGGFTILRSHKVWNEAHPDGVAQRGEEVHHKNKITDDDRPENLQKMTSAAHRSLHRQEHIDRRPRCPECGGLAEARCVYCSKSCARKAAWRERRAHPISTETREKLRQAALRRWHPQG